MQRSERPKELDLAALIARHGRFRVNAELGRGASAIVFDVFDTKLQKRLALKLFQASAPSRTQRTMRALNLLSHPDAVGLLPILESGSLDEHAYYLMERVEGQGLLRALRASGDDVQRSRLRRAFADLTRALSFLHAHGFVHRDVKPENVMVTRQDRVVLLDLDIAAPFGEESASSETIGTPEYMSPEQLAGGMLEPASDLYAVGVMMYEALSGRLPPRQSGSDREKTGPDSDVVPLTRIGIEAPEDLLCLCERLLEREPDKRPDAHAVMRALGVRDVPLAIVKALPKAPPFIGRVSERQRLKEAFARSRDAGIWAHVEGASGLGKSSLVTAVTDAVAKSHGELALIHARFDRHTSSLYGALDSAVAELASVAHGRSIAVVEDPCLSLMFPGTRRAHGSRPPPAEALPVDPHEQRACAEHTLLSWVTTIASHCPLIVWLDDVEHASSDAVRVMSSWVRSPPKGALIITCSPNPPWPFVLKRAVEHIVLSPVSREEARSLAAHTAGLNLTSDPLRAECELTPWSIIEAARGASASEHEAEMRAEPSLATRLSQLSEDELLLLELLSIAERKVSYEDLHHAAGIAEWNAAKALDTLKRRALVHFDASERVAELDAKTAELIRQSLPTERERAHHARFLRVSRGHGAREMLLSVAHARGASDMAALTDACWEAARAARKRLSFALAAELVSLATSIDLPKDAAQVRELGDILALAGENIRAAEAYARASESASAAERVELSRIRARLLLCEGHVDEALDAAREVLSSVGLELPNSTGRVIASLVWNKALLSLSRSRFRPVEAAKIPAVELSRVDALWTTGTLAATTDALLGIELTTRCTRRALRCGESQRVARALLYEALNDVVTERPPFTRARKLLAHAAELTEGRRDPALDGYVRMVQGVIHFFAGEPTAAVGELDAADEIFRRHTVRELSQLTARQFALQALLMMAQVREARTRTEHLMNQAEARGDQHALALLTAVGVVPALLFTEDDPKAAREALAVSMRMWPSDRVFVQHLNALIAELIILEYERRPGTLAAIEKAMAPFAKSPLFRAPPVRGVISCFRVYGSVLEAAYARGSARRPWIERAQKEIRELERAPFGFTQRRAIQLAPQVHLVAGDKEAALHAARRAHTEFVRAGQDVNWAEVMVGKLEGTLEGRARAENAHQRIQSFGYRNIDRAFAAAGVDLLDTGML